MKKTPLILAMAGILTIGGTVFAYADSSKDVQDTGATRVENIMKDEGLSFNEAKEKNLQNNINRVDEKISNGDISKEDGEKLKENMQERSSNCTRPREMKGTRKGLRNGNGLGDGSGRGNGNGLRDGSCLEK